LLLLCFFLSLLFMLGKLLRFRGSASRDGNVALSMAIAAMLTYALCLNVDGNTGWIYVYNFFPGAKAIRVVSRYYIFLGFPVACVGVYGLSLLRARAGSVLACAVCALLLAEQLNPDFNQAIERETAVQRLRMAQHVPAPCRAFFVTDARPLAIGQGDVDRVYRPNVEAMLLSEYVNLPTINGFSTFNPPDWHFDHAEHPEYAGLVRDFSERHHIDGLCALELTDMRWSEPPAVKSPDGGMASRP
jgi:hypothetical protein